MSQWTEIRQMHLADGIPKKEIARRLGVNVKTVRRALLRTEAPVRRRSPPRGQTLDAHREQIEELIRKEPKITAKRIRTLLLEEVGAIHERTVRKYVAKLRAKVQPAEAFVHRTHLPGDTMEADFGESWAIIGGVQRKVKFLVVVLPGSNAFSAKAYQAERTECLMDGLASAFEWFGSLPRRAVLDNTSLAVRQVLKGTERIENPLFMAFRGSWPVHADFCTPGKGWEKGSVERGVEYVRANCFVPCPEFATWQDLNDHIRIELERDLDFRKLRDGQTAREALASEREHLRPLPAHRPEACRVIPCVADKFAHVRVDRATYSIPIAHARQPVTVKLFHDRVECVVGGILVASHVRTYEKSKLVLDPLHVLPLLERKHRAVGESTAIAQWRLPDVFSELRSELLASVRKGDQEWISILRLTEEHGIDCVAQAARKALDSNSARHATIVMILRQGKNDQVGLEPLTLTREDLGSVHVQQPDLHHWDSLLEQGV